MLTYCAPDRNAVSLRVVSPLPLRWSAVGSGSNEISAPSPVAIPRLPALVRLVHLDERRRRIARPEPTNNMRPRATGAPQVSSRCSSVLSSANITLPRDCRSVGHPVRLRWRPRACDARRAPVRRDDAIGGNTDRISSSSASSSRAPIGCGIDEAEAGRFWIACPWLRS